MVNQVLEELGIELNEKLAGINPGENSLAAASKNKQPVAVAAGGEDADLEARLEALKRQ